MIRAALRPALLARRARLSSRTVRSTANRRAMASSRGALEWRARAAVGTPGATTSGARGAWIGHPPSGHPGRLPGGREAAAVTHGVSRARRARANATNVAAHVRARGVRNLRGSLDLLPPRPRHLNALPDRRRLRGTGRITHGRRRDRGGRSGIAGRRGIRRWLWNRAGIRRRQRRRRGLRSRQVAERIDVALRIGREPDAEMDVRLRELGIATRADGPHDLSFRDRVSARAPSRRRGARASRSSRRRSGSRPSSRHSAPSPRT